MKPKAFAKSVPTGLTVVPLSDDGAFYVVADSWVEKLRRSGGDEEVLAHFEDILGRLIPKVAAATKARSRTAPTLAEGFAAAVKHAGNRPKGAFRFW